MLFITAGDKDDATRLQTDNNKFQENLIFPNYRITKEKKKNVHQYPTNYKNVVDTKDKNEYNQSSDELIHHRNTKSSSLEFGNLSVKMTVTQILTFHFFHFSIFNIY